MWRTFLAVMLVSACSDADGVRDVDVAGAAADSAADVEAEVAEVEADGVADVEAEVAEVVADGVAEVEAEVAEWRWEPGPSLPTAVQENAVLVVGDVLWVMGGFQNLQLVDRVRVLAAGATSWSEGPKLPRALHHLNAAVVGEIVYVVGSLEGFGFSATADAWRLDAAASAPTWTPIAPMPSDRRRGSAGVAVVGADIYVIGGFRGGAVAEVDVFDTAAAAGAAWTALPSLPGARDHGAAVAHDGKVYYLGGRDSDIAAVHDDVWVFDPATPAAGWVALAPLPTARGGIAAAVYDGLVIVIGGEGNGAAASGVFPDVEAYDPATDRWQVLPPLPTPRHGTGAAVFEGTLWLPGGADVRAFGASAVVERLVHIP